MSIVSTNWFRYFRNFVIGIGASVVMLGALYKIENWEGGSEMLTIGLVTEAFLFFFLGIIGPDKQYYWEKLYPGLDQYKSNITPLTAGDMSGGGGAGIIKPLDGEKVENRLGGMLTELQSMSKSLGALKALQEVDFTDTGDKLKKMNNFYSQMTDAMEVMTGSVEETRLFKDELNKLNGNMQSLNNVYGNILSAMNRGPQA